MTSRIMSKISQYWILSVIGLVSIVAAIVYVMLFVNTNNHSQPDADPNSITLSDTEAMRQYPVHTVIATKFWIGEAADESNAYIPNHESAWVGDWLGEYGGVDDPNNRCGYLPCGFTPKQNAFYVALPFNDIDADGEPKGTEILKRIPWYTGQLTKGVSLMKNRWVEVKHGDKTAYGQIEDVGPMYEDDVEYVFGTASPKFKAGLDMSPALNDYLGATGFTMLQWRFVAEHDVPAGPWRGTVTTSQVNY